MQLSKDNGIREMEQPGSECRVAFQTHLFWGSASNDFRSGTALHGLVRPERFELPTLWFVAKYSIQLSYGRFTFGGERGIRTLDGILSHTPLAGERLRPLGHLSGAA